MAPPLNRQTSFTRSSSPSRSRFYATHKIMLRWAAVASALLLFYLCWTRQPEDPAFPFSSRITSSAGLKRNTNRKAIIAASLVGDDTAWIQHNLPDWDANIYVMNNQSADLTVKRNKGRESTAYLTYIIDNYLDLPHYMVFIHALRYQWHNEDPMYDGIPVLKNLRLSHVDREGYTNLRCTWSLGCPAEIQPVLNDASHPLAINEWNTREVTEASYAAAFTALFPSGPAVPSKIGIPCGAQFALSRNAVLARPRADYERVRQWLWDTELDDAISGRILEYSWHLLMGKPAVHCPDAETCFCEKFGLCELECADPSGCEKRYHLPQYANLPDGWPEVGPGEDGWPAKGWHE